MRAPGRSRRLSDFFALANSDTLSPRLRTAASKKKNSPKVLLCGPLNREGLENTDIVRSKTQKICQY